MKRIHVMVVDDSALVRQTLVRVLEAAGDFDVSVAADAAIAEKRIEARRPDVILLDIEMPGMNGLAFLDRLQGLGKRIPVVICSARAAESAGVVLDALTRGAVDVIGKPRLAVREFFEEAVQHVAEVVRAAAISRLPRAASPRWSASAVLKSPHAQPQLPSLSSGMRTPLIAIGASTGGTEAIRTVLMSLPANSPPIVIVQHMPEGFTAAFARRLNDTLPLSVKEAEDGDLLEPGHVLIAPGGRAHMMLTHGAPTRRVRLVDDPPVNRHRPSVDVLLESVAAEARGSVGVLLTGMGRDGARGLLAMRQSGCHTIAQDEATSVVFGMPREAALLDAAVEVLGLEEIADAIIRAGIA